VVEKIKIKTRAGHSGRGGASVVCSLTQKSLLCLPFELILLIIATYATTQILEGTKTFDMISVFVFSAMYLCSTWR